MSQQGFCSPAVMGTVLKEVSHFEKYFTKIFAGMFSEIATFLPSFLSYDETDSNNL